MAAEERRIWTYIDPEASTSEYLLNPPEMPIYRAPPESETNDTKALDAADRTYARELRTYSAMINDWNALQQHYIALSQWVKNTVRKEYL